jgi:hypothetical protein
MVERPTPAAVSIGGSSVERVTTFVLLDVQVKPVTDCPEEFIASIVCVSPTTMLITLGKTVKPFEKIAVHILSFNRLGLSSGIQIWLYSSKYQIESVGREKPPILKHIGVLRGPSMK